jgi:hypothetical protein
VTEEGFCSWFPSVTGRGDNPNDPSRRPSELKEMIRSNYGGLVVDVLKVETA